MTANLVDGPLVELKEIAESEPMTPLHFIAVRSDGLTFMQCVESAADTPGLISQVDRLYGTNLRLIGAPIALMIDETTGRQHRDIEVFFRFIWNSVFIRCPAVIPGKPPC